MLGSVFLNGEIVIRRNREIDLSIEYKILE